MKRLIVCALLVSMMISFGDLSPSSVDAAPISYLTEMGMITDLGNGQYRYVTHIGEKNTWHDGAWHRYVYFPNQKAVKIGHIYIQHLTEGALRIAGENGTRINQLKWYTQAYYGGQWNNISMPQYQFVGVEKEEFSITAYQMYWGIEGKMDIALRYDYTQNLKILVNVTSWSGASVPVRAIWHASGIRGIQDNYEWVLDDNEKKIGVSIEDTNFMWNDFTETSDAYTNVVVNQAEDWVAVVFGNQTNIMNTNDVWTIDPSVNPQIDADGNDCEWENVGVGWVQDATLNRLNIRNSTAPLYLVGLFRWSIPLSNVTINSATISIYEEYDPATDNATIERVNELNVGDLEANSTKPDVTSLNSANHSFDGIESEWEASEDISDMLQDQIELSGWTSGYHFAVQYRFAEAGTWAQIRDYQGNPALAAYLNITYTNVTVTTTPTTTPTVTPPQPPAEINFFYEIFYSTEPWGYIGVMALVIIGYFLMRKDRVLGVLWFTFECLVMAHYFSFINAAPNYWWHIIILLLGGLLTCVFPLWDRKK